MTTQGDWSALPLELRQARQWCVAAPDRSPYAIFGGQVHHASLHKPEQWKTFDEALADAQLLGGGAGVGFMLTYEDPWTCVDLDVKNETTQRNKGEPIDPSKWTTPEVIAGYQAAVDKFDTYTELSSGGFGLHIWARGRIGAGARRGGVEVYSQERFIVCTGKSIHTPPKPIQDRQQLLEDTVLEIRAGSSDARTSLEEIEPEDSDMEVYERACNAANGDKFQMLCAGKWREMGFPSQSEADLALMSIFCFYSKSNEQCRTLFRCTALGQREKATKNDRYLNFTLEVIRARQQREAMVDDTQRAMAEALVKQLEGGSTGADVAAATLAVHNVPPPPAQGSIDWPPGMAGAIAAYIYNSSPRPVKEVAIVGALGFLAGICGKTYVINQSGLNIYIILIARSGIGKEAMHLGIANILDNLRSTIASNGDKFIDYTEYASGPALRKAIALNPSFLNVCGEFGRRLKRMADDSRDGPASTLRTAMTDLYQKSAPQSLVGGLGYSDKEKNVMTMQGVSYSMIGETTPGTFYEALTQTMMEDGFMSRFTLVDYTGDRPDANKHNNQNRIMDPALVQSLCSLIAQSNNHLSRGFSETVKFSYEADGVLEAFNLECDGEIRGSTDEQYRQMWNRAHLKALRFSALLAVADNWINPVVSEAHARWALDLIKRDIQIMTTRVEAGDIGTDDAARERKMIAIVREYMHEGPQSQAYGDVTSMKKSGIVPKRFLQMRLCQIACFRGAQGGATKAIDATIRSLSELGYLAEVAAPWMLEKHQYSGKAYRIVSLPPIK